MAKIKYYVVTYTHDDLVGWTKHLFAHVRYLKRQIKLGNLIVSGPSDGDHKRQAILIFAVKNQTELTQLIHLDPYYRHDLITTMTITPWKPQFGELG
ncbi:YciI family protein [Loigolactobacillus jiayinensis]|uniref:YciI family protein n=1 Tax=Loigolactobacillus jiayinensis TaxID=2486016 RepID=A0ABW1RJG0_9LACO|nr:YciI family protein [Loigolactobacillus jiayinensis]